jgi:hypothetical protein
MEVAMTIFLGFEKCFCMQFWTIVEYNKKGLTYVKLTHEVYKHKKNTSKSWISNRLYNLGEIECHES